MKCVGLARRVRKCVCKAVVDGAQASGVGIAQVGRLYGRRPQGESSEARFAGVPGQVHEHVNPVLANSRRERGVGKCRAIRPMLGQCAQSPGRFIDDLVGVIAEHLETFTVMPRQDGPHEPGYHMRAKVRRDVADPQSPRPGRIHRCQPDWLFVAVAESAMLLGYRCGVEFGAVVHRQQQAAVQSGIVRADCQCAAQ